MAVALRGFTQGTTQASGSVAIAWPAGTVAGDLAVLVAHENTPKGPTTAGWSTYGFGLFAKKVTTADLASALTVNGKVTFLQTFSGAARIGGYRWDEGIRINYAGGALFVHGYGPSWIGTITPGATDRIGNQVVSVYQSRPNAVWYRLAASVGYKELTNDDDDATYIAYEIVPSQGPNAPVVVAPVSASQLDGSQAVVFSWLHQSNSNAEQDGVQIRVRAVGSGIWSYVQSAGTITTTVTTLTQTAQSASINSGVLTSGQQYEFGIATSEFGVLGTFSATSTFTPVVKPAVTSITPTATLDSLTPTIAWTATYGVGNQEAWQVRVSKSTDTNSESPIWDSGIIKGTALSVIAPATVPWVNGQNLYAWVRVQQTGGVWSPWTKSAATFAVTWTPPVAPASVIAANVAGQPLQVTVAGINAGYDLTIEMSIDGGDNWTPVNALVNPGTPTVAQIPLAGYGITTLFRARTSVTLSDVVTLYSAWVISTALASTDTNVYLVTKDGNSFMKVLLAQDEAHQVAQGISITYGHGATRARQDQTVAMGETGTTTLQAATIAEEREVVNWLVTKGVWWLRWGPERSPGLTDKPATLMALASPPTVARLAQFNTAYRHITYQWIEQ